MKNYSQVAKAWIIDILLLWSLIKLVFLTIFFQCSWLNSACRLQWSSNYRSKPTKVEQIICTMVLYDEWKNLISAETTSRVQLKIYVMFQNCCSQCYQNTSKSEWLITTIIWKKQLWIDWSGKRFYYSYSV